MKRGKSFTKPRQPLRAQGKRGRSRERREWAADLAESLKFIEWCEQCGATGVILDIAHRLKRNKITTKAEYFMAAKLCRFKCHRGYDEATGEDVHGRMFRGITELIEKRNEQKF